MAGLFVTGLIAAGVFAACQKEGVNPIGTVDANLKAEVTTLVEAFVGQAQGGYSKGTEYMTVDSTEWFVEAGLNYSLAKSWLEFSSSQVDSVSITVPMNNGSVLSTDAYAAFNVLFDSLDHVEIEGVQHLALVDVTLEQEGDNLEVLARYVVGTGYEKTLNTNYPPGYALMWWQQAGPNCGCGDYSSSTCADRKIETRVRAAILFPMSPGDYLTDIETWTVDPYYATDIPNKHYSIEDFLDPQYVPGHSNQDFPIYFCNTGDCSTCLDNGDLSFHTQGTYDLFFWIRNNHCPSKRPLTLTVDGDMGMGYDPLYFHAVTYTFGIKHSGTPSE